MAEPMAGPLDAEHEARVRAGHPPDPDEPHSCIYEYPCPIPNLFTMLDEARRMYDAAADRLLAVAPTIANLEARVREAERERDVYAACFRGSCGCDAAIRAEGYDGDGCLNCEVDDLRTRLKAYEDTTR